jgi:hypothetical protein
MLSLLSTLLFNGGLGTKIAMFVLAASLILSVGSCTYKAVELTSAQHQVTTLQQDIGTLNANIGILKQNQVTLKSTNDANLQTIAALVKERKDAQQAIDNLAKQKQVEHAKAETANKRIEELLKNPANNGKVAPVLGETLKAYN